MKGDILVLKGTGSFGIAFIGVRILCTILISFFRNTHVCSNVNKYYHGKLSNCNYFVHYILNIYLYMTFTKEKHLQITCLINITSFTV